jgi:hypothetical protein
MREIRDKTKAYRALSGHDLEIAIAEKPVPVVSGPGEVMYVIDHHHVATALWRADVRRVPVILASDLSSFSMTEFWLAMENNRWAYPYDAHGQRVAFAEMRKHVWELEDDEFRSLSASVRDAGGYEKATVPLEEFRWADFFRVRLSPPESDGGFDRLVKKAVKRARCKAALGLPGYVGPVN